VTTQSRRALWWPGSANAPTPLVPPLTPPQYATIPQRFEATRASQDMIQGDDVLLNDVVSFQVRILTRYTYTVGATSFSIQDYDFKDIPLVGPGQPGIYDSCEPNVVPGLLLTLPPGATLTSHQLLAVQVIVRVWDLKTQTTRQITVEQAM
jgi:hypothetical protein